MSPHVGYLTPGEAAKLMRDHGMKMSADTFLRRLREGNVPGQKKIGQRHYVHRATFMESLGIPSSPAPVVALPAREAPEDPMALVAEANALLARATALLARDRAKG